MTTKPLRSQRSYGKHDRDGFIHRSWIKATGLPDHVFDGRPIIGIANTWSELVTCQVHLRELAGFVKRGVWEAGGVPIEFPAMSLPETQMRPTAMLFRNLLAMEVEESIRANRIVQMVKDDVKPSVILTRAAFENAILMHAAIGGSTNAVVHLLALAGRVGVKLDLHDFDEIAREAPLLVNLMPSGKYLMEDFCYAGGAPAVAKELGPLYRRDAVTVSGKTQGEIADAAKVRNREVIGSLEAPIGPSSGVW